MKMAKEIFYLHMPKTGGHVVNKFLETAFGRENFYDFVPDPSNIDAKQRLVLSGHLRFGDVLPRSKHWFNITFIRNPVDQLASHLRWLDHYNDEKFKFERDNFPAHVIRILDRVREVDFDDGTDLDEFISSIRIEDSVRLRNMQTELIGFSTQSLRKVDDKTQYELALAYSRSFNFIGLTHCMQEDINRLATKLGCRHVYKTDRANESVAGRQPNLKNAGVLATLREHTKADQQFFEYISWERSVDLSDKSENEENPQATEM